MMNYGGNINIQINEKKESKDEPIEKNYQNSPSKRQRRDDAPINNPKVYNPNRCAKCNKKLKLTAIKCRCDNMYCSEHIYSKNHDCSFDYKKNGRELLEKNNPAAK